MIVRGFVVNGILCCEKPPMLFIGVSLYSEVVAFLRMRKTCLPFWRYNFFQVRGCVRLVGQLYAKNGRSFRRNWQRKNMQQLFSTAQLCPQNQRHLNIFQSSCKSHCCSAVADMKIVELRIQLSRPPHITLRSAIYWIRPSIRRHAADIDSGS